MAYADRNNSGNRIVAIVIVAALQAALGYAFVTGLAYNYVKKVAEKLNTFDVAPPPPPPPDEPPPPPPPDQPLQPPPVVSPPPVVTTQSPPQVTISTQPTAPPYVPAPPAPPAPPPAPPAPRLAQAAVPRGSPGDWFSDEFYPPAAKRAGVQGRVSVALSVGADGKVADCRVTASSGNADLDETTCRLAKRFGRYKPALDENGKPIESQVRIPAVRWVLKDE